MTYWFSVANAMMNTSSGYHLCEVHVAPSRHCWDERSSLVSIRHMLTVSTRPPRLLSAESIAQSTSTNDRETSDAEGAQLTLAD